MNKKIITYAVLVTMTLSVLCSPVLGYGATEDLGKTAEPVDTLAAVFDEIVECIEGMEQPSDDTEATADEIAQPTDEMATTTDATTASMGKIEQIIDEIAENIDEIAQPTDETIASTSELTQPTDGTKGPTDEIASTSDEIVAPTNQPSHKRTAPTSAAIQPTKKITTPTPKVVPGPKVSKTVNTAKQVKAKALDYESIRISWNKVKDSNGYEIYKYRPSKKRFVKVGNTNKSSNTSYKNKKLSGDKVYRYKVRTYKIVSGKKYYSKFSSSVKVKTKKTNAQKVVCKARSKIGAAYRSGAEGPRAFDCSGFVYWVYKNANAKTKKKIPRTSSAGLYSTLKKYKVGSSIKCAKAGDIILFKRGGKYGHSAIYAGNGKIIHAANARKGVISQSVQQLHNSGTRVAAIIRVVKK